jgi:hypothetical protein
MIEGTSVQPEANNASASESFIGVKRMDRRTARPHTCINFLYVEQYTPSDFVGLQQTVLDEVLDASHRELEVLGCFLLGKPMSIH